MAIYSFEILKKRTSMKDALTSKRKGPERVLYYFVYDLLDLSFGLNRNYAQSLPDVQSDSINCLSRRAACYDPQPEVHCYSVFLQYL